MADQFSVLLIEDEIHDVENVRQAFAAVHPPIFRVQQVHRFRDAIQLIKQHHFHVAIVDLAVPDSIGLNGVQRLMSMMPAVPVIVLTAEQDEESALNGISMGVQEFLEKSELTSKRLLRAIRHAIKRKQYALQQQRGESSASDQRKLERLAELVRQTTALVTSRVDTLMQTDLTDEQRSIVADIDKTSRQCVVHINRLTPERVVFVETPQST